MLDTHFTPKNIPSLGYDLTLKADTNWRTSKFRVLVILQTVSTADLKARELVSTPHLTHALNYAVSHACIYKNISTPSWAVVNFNDKKSLHLKGHARAEAEAEFKARCLSLIEHLNPTHVFFSGDLNLMWATPNAGHKNGWVYDIDGRKVASSLDFERLMEKDGTYANLLGFWCRHLANLLIGFLPHSLADLKANPGYVNTIKRFDAVMRHFDAAKVAAVDTETRNLTVTANAIYTIQLAFDTNPLKGYVIPVDHPHEDNPFSEEERAYIKAELRKRFAAKEGPELVTFNGIFDLRIIRQALKIDIIYHTVWEITAGEHLLDENISSLASLGIKSGGLAAVYCAYGNDIYLSGDMAFGKEDRNTTGQVSPSDEGFLIYAATDVVSILGIREKQMERAALLQLENKPYGPMFERHMRFQMSDTVHQLSHLKDSGSKIDKKYLRALIAPGSKLTLAIDELKDEFKTFPEVQKANKELLSESGFKANSLFGGSNSQWIFSFTKGAHKIKLFFEIMGLKPTGQTATGADAVDKKFIEHYKERNFLVAKFGEFQAASKLLSTYAKGWYKKLTRELDGIADACLRADYYFFVVDTGRLGSGDPNLQNIPSRGKLAKIIKEMFITEDGCLLIRFDYSAHEVRGWSIVAKDMALAAAFKAGQSLRQQWIQNPTEEIKKELKTKGDVHIQNIHRFFGKWVEKSDPLRDAIKSVVFGTLYGKSAQTLGVDTKMTEFGALKAQIGEAHKAGDKKKLAELEERYDELTNEDRTEYAQNIIDKMFKEFPRGHQWVLRMQKLATEQYYVYSPIGRIRHLYAAMTKDRKIVSRQVRRGMNAPIQGFASEIAVKSSRLILVNYFKYLPKLKKMLSLKTLLPLKFNRIVHDAQYYTVPYEMVLPFIHILQYDSTYGIAKAYENEFGLKFSVEPEIEIEVGVKDTLTKKWDWAIPDLIQKLDESVKDGIETKLLTQKKADIMKLILAPWRDKQTRAFLQEKWPLLNVPDLDKQIDAALKEYDSKQS
jgi:DNA polymerase family A/3'-5' exonuclease